MPDVIDQAGEYDLTIEQGSTLAFDVTWAEDDDGETPISLTGWSALLQVRPRASSSTVLFAASSGSFGEVTYPTGTITLEPDGDEGRLLIEADPEATALITRSGVYDLELTNVGGQVVKLLRGQAVLVKEVTR